MNMLQEMAFRAKALPQRIVLPEGNDPRILKAAEKVLFNQVAEVILLGNPEEIKTTRYRCSNGIANLLKTTTRRMPKNFSSKYSPF